MNWTKHIIKFDNYEFRSLEYENEYYVNISDLSKFVGTISEKGILNSISGINYNINTNINIKHNRIYDNYVAYINWYYVVMITMMFNNEKYIKYKNILENYLCLKID